MAFLVDFVENVFEDYAEEIKRRIEVTPGQVLARKQYVLEASNELWIPQEVEELPSLGPGELRPLFSGSIGNISEQALSKSLVPGSGHTESEAKRRRLELQSLLLYAHSVALPNPFKAAPSLVPDDITGWVRLVEQPVSDAQFLVGVYAICDTAGLERENVLFYLEQPNIAEKALPLGEVVSAIGRNLYNSYAINVFDQEVLYGVARRLVEQTLFQLLNASGSSDAKATSLLVPTDMDTATFERLARVLHGAIESGSPSEPAPVAGRDQDILRQLVYMSLPGVEKVRLKDVVDIREDDAFAIFRTKMREAVRDSDQERELLAARSVIAEHMTAALSDLDSQTRRGVLADAVVGDLVGWSVGAAAAGAVAGWQGVAATLLGKGLAELTRKGPKASERALRNHYVALSDARAPGVVLSSDDEELDGGNKRLWGIRNEALETVQGQRVQKAIDAFLEIIDGDD